MQLLPTFVSVIAGLLPQDAMLLPGATVADVVECFSVDHVERLAANLLVLDSGPFVDKAREVIEADTQRISIFLDCLNDVIADDGLGTLNAGSLEPVEREMPIVRALMRDWFTTFSELTTCQPNDASAVFERFIAKRTHKTAQPRIAAEAQA